MVDTSANFDKPAVTTLQTPVKNAPGQQGSDAKSESNKPDSEYGD